MTQNKNISLSKHGDYFDIETLPSLTIKDVSFSSSGRYVFDGHHPQIDAGFFGKSIPVGSATKIILSNAILSAPFGIWGTKTVKLIVNGKIAVPTNYGSSDYFIHRQVPSARDISFELPRAVIAIGTITSALLIIAPDAQVSFDNLRLNSTCAPISSAPIFSRRSLHLTGTVTFCAQDLLSTPIFRRNTDNWPENLACMLNSDTLINYSKTKEACRLTVTKLKAAILVGDREFHYAGSEIATNSVIRAGEISVSMKGQETPGIVTSCFVITPYHKGASWDELDLVELLVDPERGPGVQFNLIQKRWGTSDDYTNNAHAHFIPFPDAFKNFHRYSVKFGPSDVPGSCIATWFIDNEPKYHCFAPASFLETEKEVRLNAWAPDNPGWVGRVPEDFTSAAVYYREVTVKTA